MWCGKDEWVDKVADDNPDMTANELTVLRTLTRCENDRTRLCCPSVQLMMRRTHLSRSAVQKALASLERRGLIVRRPRFNGRKQTTNQLDLRCRAGAPACAIQHRGGPPIEAGGASNRGTELLTLTPVLASQEQAKAAPPKADPEAEKRTWTAGVKLLVEAGNPEQQARAFLGRLAKEHGTAKLARAVELTAAEDAVEPRSFLVSLLQHDDGTLTPRARVYEGPNGYPAVRVEPKQHIHWNTPEEQRAGAIHGYQFPNGTVCLNPGGRFVTS